MADKPERWSVLIDLTKQLLTVSGGVLAVVATFAINGTSQFSSTEQRLIGAGLFFLFVSTVCALISHASVISRLRAEEIGGANKDQLMKKAGNRAAGAANISFWTFGLAFLALFVFGVVRASDSAADAGDAVKKATDFLATAGKIKSKDEWISVERKAGGNGFEVKFLTDKERTWACSIDKNGDVQSCQ